jgi:hypothetical protein
MPKLGGMAQLSRPFQIALIALGVFVLAWFAVLHRPGGSSTSSSSPSVSSAASSSAHSSGSATNGSGAAKSSSVYHGPVPGLEGLTRDVQRAHGAAAEVESNGREVQSKAAQSPGEATGGGTPAAASSSAASAPTRATAGATASAAAGSRARTHTSVHPASSSASVHPASSSASATRTGAAQRTPHARSGSAAAAPSHSKPTTAEAVAAELKHGKIVLLLFWNPHSFDDEAVEIETKLAAHRLGHDVAVNYALAKQINSFGSITRNIQVYQTPTLLIINPKLQVTTLTGLTDGYSIEQAVAEARK